jgi:hypothetical protein
MPLTAVTIVHRIARYIDGTLRKAGPYEHYSGRRPRHSTTEPGGRRRSRGGSSFPYRWEVVNVLGKGHVLRPFGVRVCVKLANNDEGAIEATMRTSDLG